MNTGPQDDEIHADFTTLPVDIHEAIGLLLEYVGNSERKGELENAWTLVREWWEQVQIEGETGVEPYPEF
jgi:hypothetical protein